jgi:hypothetical protein
LGLYFIDLSSFAFLPFATKAMLVGVLTTLPMLFSGIIFIDSFAKVKNKDSALGANLIGALVGGMLQSITFAMGIRALLVIVAGLYAAAVVLRPRSDESRDRPRRATEECATSDEPKESDGSCEDTPQLVEA